MLLNALLRRPFKSLFIRLRATQYDGQGFWLCQKRLSQGRLKWWPSSAQARERLSARELQILLWNGNPEDAGMAEDWRRVA